MSWASDYLPNPKPAPTSGPQLTGPPTKNTILSAFQKKLKQKRKKKENSKHRAQQVATENARMNNTYIGRKPESLIARKRTEKTKNDICQLFRKFQQIAN